MNGLRRKNNQMACGGKQQPVAWNPWTNQSPEEYQTSGTKQVQLDTTPRE